MAAQLANSPTFELEARCTWAAALEALGSEKEARKQMVRIKQLQEETKPPTLKSMA